MELAAPPLDFMLWSSEVHTVVSSTFGCHGAWTLQCLREVEGTLVNTRQTWKYWSSCCCHVLSLTCSPLCSVCFACVKHLCHCITEHVVQALWWANVLQRMLQSYVFLCKVNKLQECNFCQHTIIRDKWLPSNTLTKLTKVVTLCTTFNSWTFTSLVFSTMPTDDICNYHCWTFMQDNRL